MKYYRPHEAERKGSLGGSSGIRGANKKVRIKAITHAQFKAILRSILSRLHFQFFKNLFNNSMWFSWIYVIIQSYRIVAKRRSEN